MFGFPEGSRHPEGERPGRRRWRARAFLFLGSVLLEEIVDRPRLPLVVAGDHMGDALTGPGPGRSAELVRDEGAPVGWEILREGEGLGPVEVDRAAADPQLHIGHFGDRERWVDPIAEVPEGIRAEVGENFAPVFIDREGVLQKGELREVPLEGDAGEHGPVVEVGLGHLPAIREGLTGEAQPLVLRDAVGLQRLEAVLAPQLLPLDLHHGDALHEGEDLGGPLHAPDPLLDGPQVVRINEVDLDVQVSVERWEFVGY